MPQEVFLGSSNYIDSTAGSAWKPLKYQSGILDSRDIEVLSKNDCSILFQRKKEVTSFIFQKVLKNGDNKIKVLPLLFVWL